MLPDCTNQNISKQTLEAQLRSHSLLLSLMGEVSISYEVVNWFQHTLIPYFLVTGYATQTPLCGPLVSPSHFTYLAFIVFLALLLLPKYSTDPNYGPCPPARDWGSCVSNLVLLILCISVELPKILQPKQGWIHGYSSHMSGQGR